MEVFKNISQGGAMLFSSEDIKTRIAPRLYFMGYCVRHGIMKQAYNCDECIQEYEKAHPETSIRNLFNVGENEKAVGLI